MDSNLEGWKPLRGSFHHMGVIGGGRTAGWQAGRRGMKGSGERVVKPLVTEW